MHIVRFPGNLITTADRSTLTQTLLESFISLYDLTVSTVRHCEDYPARSPSYNLILTKSHMYMVPRQYADHKMKASGDALSVNSLAFAGKLLVKSDTELEAVKQESVLSILRTVGLARVESEQVFVPHDTDG